MPAQLARRYVAWLKRRLVEMIAVYVVVLGIAIYLIAFKLPLFADFSYLLPQDVPAVRDLRKLEARTKSVDTMLVIIRAETPEAQAAAMPSRRQIRR
jgi:predicted RND superfamily exporter protein